MRTTLNSICLACLTCLAFTTALAAPHPPGHSRSPQPHHSPRPTMHRPMPSHHPHHGNGWFLGSVVGGVVGGVIGSMYKPEVIVQPHVVVAAPQPQPTVIVQSPIAPVQVWVEGRYVSQVLPNGTVVQVWQPGHFEYR